MTRIDNYAVFGNPIKHSKSPLIHSAFAEQCEQQLSYRAVRVPLDNFATAAREFFDNAGCGLSVTVPFKQEACAFADTLSDRARRAGAVNTLTPQEDGRIAGENTDGIGLVRDMVVNLGWSANGRSVLIIGAGGAVRGILEPLLRESPSRVLIINRTASRAQRLAEEFAELGEIAGGGYPMVGDSGFDLVINASSAGLTGDMPELPATILTERSCCYDLVYGAGPTAFMRWAAHHAAWAVSDGLGMLVEQAAQSFHIWRGIHPETKPVIQRVRELLADSAES